MTGLRAEPAITGLRDYGITKWAAGWTGILARGELQRHYGITALRSGPLAGPAFLPVVSCSGITALRDYEVGRWPDRLSCQWRVVAGLRDYGITKWAAGRTSFLASGELQRHYGITELRSGPLAGRAFLPVGSCSVIPEYRLCRQLRAFPRNSIAKEEAQRAKAIPNDHHPPPSVLQQQGADKS